MIIDSTGASLVAQVVKNPPANAGASEDAGSISRLRRSTEEGKGNPLQYSCLENPMDRGVWWATVHGVTLEEQAWVISQEDFHAMHVTDSVYLKLPMVQ